MTTSLNKIDSLLHNKTLIEIENAIAEKAKTTIYKDDISLLKEFIKTEIDISRLSAQEIEEFIITNKERIVEFGCLLLKNQSVMSLSPGISITYAIYLMYLRQEDDAVLESYIIKRRIPNAKKFVQRLKKVKVDMAF